MTKSEISNTAGLTNSMSHQERQARRLIGIAEDIVSRTRLIVDSLRQKKLDQPALDSSGPSPDYLPADDKELQTARNELVVQSRLLADIFTGPRKYLMEHVMWSNHNSMVLSVLYWYRIPCHVPLDGSISFQDLSSVCGLGEDKLVRLVRFAMLNHIFTELETGRIAHSAISRLFAEEEASMDFLGHNMQDIYPACAHEAESLAANEGIDGDTRHCGFSTAIHEEGRTNLFEFFSSHPERMKRFGGAMRFVGSPGCHGSVESLFMGYDWVSKGSAKVVDVGGSMGHTAVDLVRHAPKLTVIVQDLPEVIQEAEVRNMEHPLPANVELQAADFFHPQPVTDADIYLCRLVFHDWPREKALEILRNQIRSMKGGAELVINDFILHPSTSRAEDLYATKIARTADLQMMVALNARERTLDDWLDMVKEASNGRLDLVQAKGFVLSFRKN